MASICRAIDEGLESAESLAPNKPTGVAAPPDERQSN